MNSNTKSTQAQAVGMATNITSASIIEACQQWTIANHHYVGMFKLLLSQKWLCTKAPYNCNKVYETYSTQ